MTGAELAAIRKKLDDRTQEKMAELIGVSLVGLKRYETDARPIPDYIAKSARTLEFCHQNGLLSALEKNLKEDL